MKKVLSLRYYGDSHEDRYGRRFYDCSWAIDLPKGMRGEEIVKIKKLTDERIELEATGRVYFRRENPGEYPPRYELEISGIGEDKRCAWCEYFQRSLENRMEKLDCEIDQRGSCIFKANHREERSGTTYVNLAAFEKRGPSRDIGFSEKRDVNQLISDLEQFLSKNTKKRRERSRESGHHEHHAFPISYKRNDDAEMTYAFERINEALGFKLAGLRGKENYLEEFIAAQLLLLDNVYLKLCYPNSTDKILFNHWIFRHIAANFSMVEDFSKPIETKAKLLACLIATALISNDQIKHVSLDFISRLFPYRTLLEREFYTEIQQRDRENPFHPFKPCSIVVVVVIALPKTPSSAPYLHEPPTTPPHINSQPPPFLIATSNSHHNTMI